MATIMIVDDDHQLRKTLHLALSIRGHRVIEVSDGADAVALLEADFPDVVLLDWHMGNKDGAETCRAIRTSDRSLPIIATSSLNRREEALAAGADYFVRKP